MLSAASEILGFHRARAESVDSLIRRFNVIKHRAAATGGFLMTSEGYSWTLLKACGIHPDQMNILIAHLQGRLPTTDAELTQLQAYIRRMGHMVDVRGRGKGRQHVLFSMATRFQILLSHLLLMP